MAITDRELFARAVNEGVMSRMELDLAEFEGKVTCSKSHYRRISEIIGYRVGPSEKRTSFKRAVAVALIAAALLLAGCAAVVYKDRIGDFFVEIFDTHIKGRFAEGSENNNEIIEEYYSLSYVPEGYELVEEIMNSGLVRYKWVNSEGNTIVFEQAPLYSSRYFIDAENGDTVVYTLNEYTIYARVIDNNTTYICNDEKYSIKINTYDEIAEEELIKIIDGIYISKN